VKVLFLTKRLAEVADEEGKIREISKLGVQMSVVAPAGRWRGPSNWAEKLKPWDYELSIRSCLFTRIDSVRVRVHCYYYPGISRVIDGEKWDLVHIDEEPYNLATYQVARQCVKRGTRFVFQTARMVRRKYPIPFNFFERYVRREAAAAIAINSAALDILRRKGFNKPAALLAQDGIDPTAFRKMHSADLRRKMGLEGAFVIGYVGQVAYRKGLDTLIQALALLPGECALVLVGAGPDGPRFRALAQELGLSARIRWEPWTDHREIAQYMSAFDVFVLPSRSVWSWKEQFGRVLIEAMACETCVVGSDSGEIPNVLGNAGIIFHEGDAQGLASCLRRLMEEPSLRDALGRRGRERVLKHFTYSKVARDTIDFYRRICSSQK
jgi:glycosyltransferase involved in cell wall biosynthesis